MAPACEGEVKMGHRIRCFFDIEIDGIPSGRVVFELFSDACPKTCENFRALCTGEMGDGRTTCKPLHYRGVKFHRVIKDFMIQAGDFSAGNGTGGESIYGGQFEDENFDLHHEEPFLLSMANKGKNTNGSQFFITTQPATHLDGKHVVFGRVVSGHEVVVTIENLPVDNRSRPLQPAVISNCGELVLQRTIKTKEKKRKKKKESVSSSESDSDVDKKKKRKKKKKEKKQKYKKNESSGEEGEVKDDGSEAGGDTAKMRSHPLVSVSIINPDEIPDVPKNRFLYRAGPENNDEESRLDRGRDRTRSTVRAYTKSGRKVKGRGSLRYRTPSRSRSRSRSRTPPHWRQAQRRTISYEQLQKMNEEKMRREQERQTRQQERDQEIEERRRRREQRHRENEENGGKLNENSKYGSHSEREQGMKGDWRDSRDRMRRDFRDGRAPQGWRNGRDRQRGGEHDWREAQERTRAEEESREDRNVDWKADREEGGFSHQDLRKKLQNQRERPESGANDVGRRMHKQSHSSEKNDVKKDQEDLKSKQQDGRKKEKHDDLDETALDYEAMDNEEEEEEEDEGKKNVNGKVSEMNKAGHKPPPAREHKEEMKGAENMQSEKQEKEVESKKENNITAEKDQTPDHKNKDYGERHKDRIRDKPRQSRDRPIRSQDTRSNRSRERRSNRSRERRNRSRDRRDRSKDRRDRSRDRASRRDRSRERRDRSRDRRSRSRERTRDRRRHRSDSSKSSSSSSSSSSNSRSN